MTEYPLALARGEKPENAARKRHPLEELDKRLARRLVMFRPALEDFERLLKMGESGIGALADIAVVQQVAAHNPDSLWAIARAASFDPEHPKGSGFVTMLLLNKQGLTALAAGTLDCLRPACALLAKAGERPAGVYFWAVYIPGTLAAAARLVIDKFSEPPYEGVPLYARTVTAAGTRFVETLGFKKGAVIDGVNAPHLFVYERRQAKPAKTPPYDTYRDRNGRKAVTVTVARDADDWLRVVSIRSAVYIGEQECPFQEEFDGNDFAAVHLLGYVGEEPAACLRIRHFADFAKIERLAVRKEFRKTVVAFQLVRAAIELCRAKGYRRIYGHAQKRLLNFWGRFGAVPLPGRKEFVFSDFDYVEVMGEFEPNPNAIRIGSDPYVIIRPEGRWHEPGVLERSSRRPVTRPSVGVSP